MITPEDACKADETARQLDTFDAWYEDRKKQLERCNAVLTRERFRSLHHLFLECWNASSKAEHAALMDSINKLS